MLWHLFGALLWQCHLNCDLMCYEIACMQNVSRETTISIPEAFSFPLTAADVAENRYRLQSQESTRFVVLAGSRCVVLLIRYSTRALSRVGELSSLASVFFHRSHAQ